MSTKRVFTKLPVDVEAMRFEEEMFPADIETWVNNNGGFTRYECLQESDEGRCVPEGGHKLSVVTLEGPMEVKPGAWVIRGVKGEFYPCDDEIFRLTYSGVFDEDPAV